MNLEQQQVQTMTAEPVRHRGEVVNFSRERGWGFIRPGSAEKDIYVNWRNCPVRDDLPKPRYLRAGESVTYLIGEGPTGKQAIEVEVVE